MPEPVDLSYFDVPIPGMPDELRFAIRDEMIRILSVVEQTGILRDTLQNLIDGVEIPNISSTSSSSGI